MKAIVTEIQVGGYHTCHGLKDVCEEYLDMLGEENKFEFVPRTKIHFTIKLPSGETRTITIRDEDEQVVAYGDFEGLPSFLDYSKDALAEVHESVKNKEEMNNGLGGLQEKKQ